MNQRLLFLGPPGAGKGTQADLLCQDQGLLHLSTGDLLRAEVEASTDLGKKAAALMDKGELVSDELVLSIVEKRLLENKSNGWLLDGFPRNLSQAVELKLLLQRINQPIEAVLLLELNDEVLMERLLSRGRKDDNEKVIRHRLEVYREKTAPLIDFYRKEGLLNSLKANGEINEISIRIREKLSSAM